MTTPLQGKKAAITMNWSIPSVVTAVAKEESDGESRFWKVNSSAVIVNTGNSQQAAHTQLFQEADQPDCCAVG